MMRVAIIGGGITGLSAAYYLQKEILTNNLEIEYHLFEKDDRLGGKIQTDYYDGFVIDKGPDSFLAGTKSASKLAKEVGLEKELVSNRTGQSYVLKGDTLHPIPEGAMMGIPTKLGPFLTTGLFSAMGKVRAGIDLILPKGETNKDQSLGQFFRRRLGNEVVDSLIDPLLSGIYAGDIDRLSLQSTFPQFQQVEQSHRSLILGMKTLRPPAPKTTPEKQTGAFLTCRNGLQSLVHAIENHLDEDAVHKNEPLEKITPKGSQFMLTFKSGRKELFDRVILTSPAYETASFLEEDAIQEWLKKIPFTTVATVAMAFNESQLKTDIDGTGFVVSKKSDYQMTACTWTHRKWAHAAPPGKALLRCYVGKPGEEDIVNVSDDEMIDIVLKDLNRVMEIEGKPEYYVITRWKKAMPQYVVHHRERLQKGLEIMNQKYPGVYVAGAAFEGVGLPDCIDQGENVVKKLLASK